MSYTLRYRKSVRYEYESCRLAPRWLPTFRSDTVQSQTKTPFLCTRHSASCVVSASGLATRGNGCIEESDVVSSADNDQYHGHNTLRSSRHRVKRSCARGQQSTVRTMPAPSGSGLRIRRGVPCATKSIKFEATFTQTACVLYLLQSDSRYKLAVNTLHAR